MKNIARISLCAFAWLTLAPPANAAGAPILSAPLHAWEAQGAAEAHKEREERRREKMKALMAFADSAASQGRELSEGEWSNIANDIIGFSSTLNGTAPSRAVLESIRLNANAKARRVVALQEQQALERSRQVQSNVPNARGANSPEATAARAAFESYKACVAGAAGRLLSNNQESAAAIAEAVEPSCVSQATALLDAIAVAFGPPASSAHADERYRTIRARVIKDVSVGIMQVRQEQAAEKSSASAPQAEGDAPYRVICSVTRPDGSSWGSPVWFTVDRAAGYINGAPAMFGKQSVTWHSQGTGLLSPRLAFGADPAISMVYASNGDTFKSVYQGPCKRDATYGARTP